MLVRHISDEGRCLIRAFEGFQPMIYRCPAGWNTIGYGHVVRPGEDFTAGITLREADDLLSRDLSASERAVDRLLPVPLTPGQLDALVSFTFNLGAGALQRSTLRRKVLRGEPDAAAREFLRWVYGGGRPLKGLLRRRMAESRRFLELSWN